MERTTLVGRVVCQKGQWEAIFGKVFVRGIRNFSGMSNTKLTMVNELASGMMCGVAGSLLLIGCLIAVLLQDVKEDQFETI